MEQDEQRKQAPETSVPARKRESFFERIARTNPKVMIVRPGGNKPVKP